MTTGDIFLFVVAWIVGLVLLDIVRRYGHP